MSELLIEHPVLVVEELLKLGMGDEGRLLYLRNAITRGTIIHKSDKNYLKKMELKLDEIKSTKSDKPSKNSQFENTLDKTIIMSDDKYKFFKHENHSIKNKQFSGTDSGTLKIQNLIGELKKSESKLIDNLELLLLSREVSSQKEIDNSISISSFSNSLKNHNADLFAMIKDNPLTENKSFRIKKHDVMAATSAGLFALWFASYQNLIDMGPLQYISLGLSASLAVSAGIFYKKYKTSKKQNF